MDTPVARLRRESIRTLSAVGNASLAALRFLLATDLAPSVHEEDVWRLSLPLHRRRIASRPGHTNYGLEKWLVCNAFLCRAVGTPISALHPRAASSSSFFDFVILADDDALYFVPSLQRLLSPFVEKAWREEEAFVFGNVEEWFMWDAVAMISTCFAYSSRRWELATQYAAGWRARNASLDTLPRRHRECLQPTAVGPFPYVKGHFLGYSRRTAINLVQLFDNRIGSSGLGVPDEEYALTTRASTPIFHPFFNTLLPSNHHHHPSQKVTSAIPEGTAPS
ncbi:hypothetical protein AB1Y20_014202 [Prymnesium parvum]|uniref:Hexosyltransferase n=1 Tax=Prymnesium parvum TaxID=97485 RepID=A0AB34IDL9_PRYPA